MRNFLATVLGVALALTATVALAGRNSSGTMSFTSVAGGYPFQSGQTISSSGVNSNFSELATELSDSLSRSGKGGMSAPLRCADGTAAAPAFSWTSDTNTGFYRIGADNVGLALGGSKYVDFSTSGLAVTGWAAFSSTVTGAGYSGGPISGTTGVFSSTVSGTTVSASTAFRAADGTVSAPGYSFTDDTNTGLYRIGADNVGLSLGGSVRVNFAATNVDFSSGDVTISAASGNGSLLLTRATDQAISKTGGLLKIGTYDSNPFTLYTNNTTRLTLAAGGGIDVHSQVISNVTNPASAQDAATKAYADALVAAATTTLTAGSGWSFGGTGVNSVTKRGGVVTVTFAETVADSGASDWLNQATVPAGFRPASTVYFRATCVDAATANYTCEAYITTDGVLGTPFYDNGTSMVAIFAIGAGDGARGTVTYVTN